MSSVVPMERCAPPARDRVCRRVSGRRSAAVTCCARFLVVVGGFGLLAMATHAAIVWALFFVSALAFGAFGALVGVCTLDPDGAGRQGARDAAPARTRLGAAPGRILLAIPARSRRGGRSIRRWTAARRLQRSANRRAPRSKRSTAPARSRSPRRAKRSRRARPRSVRRTAVSTKRPRRWRAKRTVISPRPTPRSPGKPTCAPAVR